MLDLNAEEADKLLLTLDHLAANAARGFRAVQVAGVTDGRQLAMPREAFDALRIKEGVFVDIVPLP